MGTKDTVTKKFMQNAEIFADAFNFHIYGGEQVIKAENLRELDPTSIALPYGDDRKLVPIQKFRDLLKLFAAMEDGNAVYLILGIENQSEVHYAMPVKIGLYDMVHYADQVSHTAKSHKAANDRGNSNAEFLSGFHKTDNLLPVITLVVYFGANEWDAPRSIHDMIQVQDKRILKFVPDYYINLIAPLEIPNEEFAKFSTELSTVLKYIKHSKDKNQLNAVLHDDEAFRNVTRQAAEVINAVTNSHIEFNEGEETVDMCKAIEDMRNEAIQEGEAKGRAEGEAKGRAEGEAKGRAEGEAKGRAEGEAKGRAETLKEVLEKMVKSGINEDQAKKILGLA